MPIQNFSHQFSPLHSIFHLVEVDVEGRNNLAVIGGGLPGPYLVKQFHFHWGSQDSRGSEHDINGRFFPMEVWTALDILP